MSHGVDAEGLMSYIHDLYTAGKRNQIRSIMTSIALLCGDLDEYVDAMVQQVNETEVSTEDCLSDHVQHYDSKEAVIENAEKRVSRLEKFNKISDQYLFVISFHEQEHPLSYYFK